MIGLQGASFEGAGIIGWTPSSVAGLVGLGAFLRPGLAVSETDPAYPWPARRSWRRAR